MSKINTFFGAALALAMRDQPLGALSLTEGEEEIVEKAKYKRRWRGPNGKWQYDYGDRTARLQRAHKLVVEEFRQTGHEKLGEEQRITALSRTIPSRELQQLYMDGSWEAIKRTSDDQLLALADQIEMLMAQNRGMRKSEVDDADLFGQGFDPPVRYPVQMGPPPDPNREKFPYVGSLNFHGILIYVENDPGSMRSGVGPEGAWSVRMQNYYGEIPGTMGSDGDPVDVYVGWDWGAETAYVVHQENRHATEYTAPGVYDEDKVMIGFASKEEALAAYAAHFDVPVLEPPCTEISVSMLRDMLAEGELEFGAIVKHCGCASNHDEDDLVKKGEDPVGEKIKLLMDEGYPQRQAVAIALDMKRRGTISKADRLQGGRADHMQPSDFDDHALAQGMAHELEHTESLAIAREIAMDHLAEDPHYYQKLKMIEKGGGAIGRAIDALVEQGYDHADAVAEVFDAYNDGKLDEISKGELVFELIKGRKAYPIGWVSFRKDGHYRKEAKDRWVQVDPNKLRWENDPTTTSAQVKPGDVVTVAGRDGLWMLDPDGPPAGSRRSVRVVSLASGGTETVRRTSLQPMRPKQPRKKVPPPRKGKTPPPPKAAAAGRAGTVSGPARVGPQPGLDENLAHPSEKARRMKKFKGSRAAPGTILHNLENGEYMMRQVKDRTGVRMRWTVHVPAEDQVKLVEEFTPLMHKVSMEVAKRRPFVPMRRGGELTPEYEEVLSGAKLGMLMSLRNYDGTKPYLPWAESYMRSYAAQAKRVAAGSARPLTERQRRLLHTFIAAQFQAESAVDGKASPQDIAERWYITKRQVFGGDAGDMGRYIGPTGDAVDQAYEPVPMEPWQIMTPTGEPRGKMYPGKLQLVAKMQALTRGDRVVGFIDEEGQGDQLLYPPDMPAGLVEHVKGEIETAVERLKEPHSTIIRMLAGLHDDKGPDRGGRPATNAEIGRVLHDAGYISGGRSDVSLRRDARPLIEEAKTKLRAIAAARGYTAERYIDRIFPAAPALTETQEMQGTWFPNHSELKRRWKDNWAVRTYFDSIRHGEASEVGRLLDLRAQGKLSEADENALKRRAQRWMDDESAMGWAKYRESIRDVDPTEARDSGIQGGQAETMLNDAQIQWMLRTVGSVAESAKPIPALARHLPPK